MKRTFSTISKIFTLLSDLASSSDVDKARKRDSIGFSFGPTYGAGASYRKSLFNGKMGVQGTMCPPIWASNNSFFAGGLTIFYNFSDITSWARPYVSFGAGAGLRGYSDTLTICPQDPDYNPDEINESNLVEQHNYYPKPVKPPGSGELEPKEPEIIKCYRKQNTQQQWLIGLGPALGIEMRFNQLLTFNIELPLAFSWTDTGFQIIPIPNVSIRADI